MRFKLYNHCNPMDLVIEALPAAAKKIGLTKEDVQVAVESRLRSARLYSSEPQSSFFYVNLNVIGSSFNIMLQFNKEVYDPASNNTRPTATWVEGTTGTHSGDGGYILSSLSRLIDKFLVEYLRVNEDACEKKK